MDIIVYTKDMTATTGILKAGDLEFPCTLGKSGVTRDKSEGDNATPLGTFPLREVFYRPDRVSTLQTALPVRELTEKDGWCEDPEHADYNRHVVLPHDSTKDEMYREDHLYDIVVVVGYNDDPPVPGKGSAIFMHLAREAFTPTAGCVGLRREDLLAVLKKCDSSSTLTVLPPSP